MHIQGTSTLRSCTDVNRARYSCNRVMEEPRRGSPAGRGQGLGRWRVSGRQREQVNWWPWYLHPQIGVDKPGGRPGRRREASQRRPGWWWGEEGGRRGVPLPVHFESEPALFALEGPPVNPCLFGKLPQACWRWRGLELEIRTPTTAGPEHLLKACARVPCWPQPVWPWCHTRSGRPASRLPACGWCAHWLSHSVSKFFWLILSAGLHCDPASQVPHLLHDREIGAQRGAVTYPRSLSKWVLQNSHLGLPILGSSHRQATHVLMGDHHMTTCGWRSSWIVDVSS